MMIQTDGEFEMDPIAFFNGKFVPFQELQIPVYDTGFVMGVTLAEQLRTFNGTPFWVRSHLQRLQRGMQLLKIRLEFDMYQLEQAIRKVVDHNRAILHPRQELGITLFVTPGPYPAYDSSDQHPIVAIHTYPLIQSRWQAKYESGETLITVNTRQVPSTCWPSGIKCRSRMHYFLASQEAKRKNESAIALLMNQNNQVTETPIANMIAYFKDQGLVSPRFESILPGISLQYVRQLAARLQIPFRCDDLTPEKLMMTDEILLSSTPFCILPVTLLNDHAINDGQPGPMFRRLLHAWSDDVGLRIDG